MIDTRWGRFVGSNLTPDPTHGLGRWSFEDFERAMRHGRSPRGRPYYPAFPYPFFAGMTRSDLEDLWAYLRTLPAVDRPEEGHRLRGLNGWRFLLRFWKILGFHPRSARIDDPEGDRGAYLGRAVGHCGGCHTPRGPLGVPRRRWTHAGTDEPPAKAPNITPSEEGIGAWSLDELVDFLADGSLPDGDLTGREMRRVVREGTARLSEADRRALAAWVLSQPPLEEGPGPKRRDR